MIVRDVVVAVVDQDVMAIVTVDQGVMAIVTADIVVVMLVRAKKAAHLANMLLHSEVASAAVPVVVVPPLRRG
jgi:hypothetical protein